MRALFGIFFGFIHDVTVGLNVKKRQPPQPATASHERQQPRRKAKKAGRGSTRQTKQQRSAQPSKDAEARKGKVLPRLLAS